MAKTLKQLRESAGLTQTQVAKLMGYRWPSAYNAMERNKRPGKNHDVAKLIKLAAAFDVPLEELFAALDGGSAYGPLQSAR